MRILSNAHVHTTYCDGINTPEEIIKAAVALGFSDIGFSSHTRAPFDPGCPGVTDPAAYKEEISALKDRYSKRISVLCGAEQDFFSPVEKEDYDYIIHSSHYLPGEDGNPWPLDSSPELTKELIKTRYFGDGAAMAEDYFELLAKGVGLYLPDIVGHIDLVTKFNDDSALFDESSAKYQDAAVCCLDKIATVINGYGGMIEINTGGMRIKKSGAAYGGAPFLLERILRSNLRVIITGDSHSADTLDYGFNTALQALRQAGFSSMAVLSGGEFTDVKI